MFTQAQCTHHYRAEGKLDEDELDLLLIDHPSGHQKVIKN